MAQKENEKCGKLAAFQHMRHLFTQRLATVRMGWVKEKETAKGLNGLNIQIRKKTCYRL